MTLILIVLNFAIFLLEQTAPPALLDSLLLWPPSWAATPGTPSFHVWQLLTCGFLHANFTHIAFNMFGLYMFGRDVERSIGGARLLHLYLASIIAGSATQVAVMTLAQPSDIPTLGASAGVFGVLVSYAILFPQRRLILLFPPIPMPAWLFAAGYAVLELLLGLGGGEPGVAHFAHLGGMLGAMACLYHWAHRERRWS